MSFKIWTNFRLKFQENSKLEKNQKSSKLEKDQKKFKIGKRRDTKSKLWNKDLNFKNILHHVQIKFKFQKYFFFKRKSKFRLNKSFLLIEKKSK